MKVGLDQALDVLSDVSENLYFSALKGPIEKEKKRDGLEILEIGAGIGAISAPLLSYGRVTACEIDNQYLIFLKEKFKREKSFRAVYWDATEPIEGTACPDEISLQRFDLVVAINVLEHIKDDLHVIKSWKKLLKKKGKLLLLVPNYPFLYSPIDAAVGHQRRYTRNTLKALIESSGGTITHFSYVNPLGALGWFLYGKVFRSAMLPRHSVKAYHWLKPLCAPIESLLGRFMGLSLLVSVRYGRS